MIISSLPNTVLCAARKLGNSQLNPFRNQPRAVQITALALTILIPACAVYKLIKNYYANYSVSQQSLTRSRSASPSQPRPPGGTDTPPARPAASESFADWQTRVTHFINDSEFSIASLKDPHLYDTGLVPFHEIKVSEEASIWLGDDSLRGEMTYEIQNNPSTSSTPAQVDRMNLFRTAEENARLGNPDIQVNDGTRDNPIFITSKLAKEGNASAYGYTLTDTPQMAALPDLIVTLNGPLGASGHSVDDQHPDLSSAYGMDHIRHAIDENQVDSDENYYNELLTSNRIIDILVTVLGQLKEGGNIHIHCNKGEHRSASITVLLVAIASGLSFEEAYNYVWNHRTGLKSYTSGRETMMKGAFRNFEEIKNLVDSALATEEIGTE